MTNVKNNAQDSFAAPTFGLAFPIETGGHGLDEVLATTLLPMQTAYRACIESLPRKATSAGALAVRLGLPRKTVWRFWQTAYADRFEECALHLTGDQATERVLEGMMAIGLDPAKASAARAAHADAVQQLEEEAGDLTTLRLVLSPVLNIDEGEGTRVSRVHFDASRHRLGVQASRVLKLCIRQPAAFENLTDLYVLSHFAGLRSLRQTDAHVLSVRRATETMAKSPLHASPMSIEPFDTPGPPAGTNGAVSSVINELSHLNGRSSWIRPVGDNRYHLCISGMVTGRKGESSVCTGEIARAATPMLGYTQLWASGGEVTVPCEELVLDVYVSDNELSMWDVAVSALTLDMVYAANPLTGRLVSTGPRSLIEHYPPGRARPQPERFDEYSRILGLAERKSKADTSTLHLFRWRVVYPLVGMSYLINFQDIEGEVHDRRPTFFPCHAAPDGQAVPRT